MRKHLLLTLITLFSVLGGGKIWALDPFKFNGWPKPTNGQAFWTTWTAQNGLHRINAPYYRQQENVVFESDGNLTVTFNYTTGTKRLDIIGVDLLKNGVVVKSDYHAGFTGNQHSNNEYTLSDIEAGTYTIRYWVPKYDNNNEASTDSHGNIVNNYSGTCNTVFTITSWTTRLGDEWTASQDAPSALGLKLKEQGYGPNNNLIIHEEPGVKFYEAGTFNVHYQYSTGQWGLNLRGIEVLDGEENVIACEYHEGFVGGTPRTPDYKIYIPSAGTYTIRHIAHNDNNDMANANNCNGTITYTCTSNTYHAKQYLLDKYADFGSVEVGEPIPTSDIVSTYSTNGRIVADNIDAFTTAFNVLPVQLPATGYYRLKCSNSVRYIFNDPQYNITTLNEGAYNSKYYYKASFNQESQKMTSLISSLGIVATKKASQSTPIVNIGETTVGRAKYASNEYVTGEVFLSAMNVNTGSSFTITGQAYNATTNPNFLINWGENADTDRGNCWIFEPIDENIIYTINVIGGTPSDVNVTYTVEGYEGNPTVNANGFFAFESAPSVQDFTVTDGFKISSIENNVITVIAKSDVLTAGKFYRFYNVGKYKKDSSKYYLAATKATNDDSDKAIIFYYNDDKLLQYSTGEYMTAGTGIGDPNYNSSSYSLTIGGGSTLAVLNHSSEANAVQFRTNNSSAMSWWDTRTKIFNHSKLDDTWGYWYAEEVTSLPISIAPSGYTTMYSPVSLTLPEELEAYTASVNEQTAVVTYTKVSGVPANTGVLLYRISGKSESETPHVLGTNGITGVQTSSLLGQAYTQAYDKEHNTIGTTSLGTSYVYTLQSGKFKWYTGTKLTGFKAHLELEDGRETGNARTYTFTFDDNTPTGITEIDGMIESNATIYDLSGRKMTHLQKGINIVNGKKVIR